MVKKIFKILDRYSYIASRIRKVILFTQNYPEIIDALLDVPLWESAILFCYVVWITDLWIGHIKQHYPMLYRIALLADNYMPIPSDNTVLFNLLCFWSG